jgi:beta-phosphoglucomutase-like phosphatase (HAD superfamily)
LERLSVIFDLDGTLVETEQIWRDVRRQFVTTHGGRWNDAAAAAMIGMRTSEWADYIHAELGVAMPPGEIAKAVVGGVIARLKSVPVLPGAPGALERLAAAFPLGLATSASLPVATAVLEKTGWTRFFEAVVSADDVQRGKPAPDVYLRALELMHADPKRTAAVEDSANGIRSAHAAGPAVIAIPNREFPPDAGSLALASKVLRNLDALTVDVVRAAVSR